MSERSKDHSQGERSHGQKKDTHIDHLLQQVLKDDIPPDVETALKDQLDQYRLRMEQAEARTISADRKIFRRLSQLEGARWLHFLLHKEVLVVVSLLMIVLGGFIQSSGSSNQLTENLSVLGTSVAVSSQMNRSHSMECSIQLSRESRKPLIYSVKWLSPNLSKIEIKESDNTHLKTLWLLEEEIVIADHLDGKVYKKRHLELFNDPMIQPILGYLAPMDLIERMYGEWNLKQTVKKGPCEQRIFTVSLPNEKTILEVAVNLCTFLPVSIKKVLPAEKPGEQRMILNVRYTWNAPLTPENLSPKPIKESQKA